MMVLCLVFCYKGHEKIQFIGIMNILTPPADYLFEVMFQHSLPVGYFLYQNILERFMHCTKIMVSFHMHTFCALLCGNVKF